MERKYRYFDPDFKSKAVLLSYKQNNQSQLAKLLNITPSLLFRWRNEFELLGEEGFSGKGKIKNIQSIPKTVEQEKKTTKSQRRYYDSAYKEKIVLLSYQAQNISQLEREYDLTPGLIPHWRVIYDKYGEGCFRGSGIPRKNPDEQAVYELENKCIEAELHLEILKNSRPYLSKGKYAIFEFIKKNEKKYTILKSCRALGISESSYRLWKKMPVSETKQRIIFLKEKISSAFYDSGRRYGGVRIAKELTNSGTKISRTQVGLYMAQMGLRPKAKRKFKITTDSKHNFYTSQNILNQRFKVSGPSMVWVSDITYIQTAKGFIYLTIIMDLYDRKIIGWSLNSTMTARRTTLAAWEMAVTTREVKKGLLFHSDRGKQYACRAFTNKLDSYKCITRSMSRKENFIDNAPAESFFNTLKRELIYQNKLISRKHTKEAVIDYIEEWYNKKRIHSSLNYKTIEEFNSEK